MPSFRTGSMQVTALLQSDPIRMAALQTVFALGLPDCWLAAGFIRNMVWDALHGYAPTPLNDIDVIFYDLADSDGGRAREAQDQLNDRGLGQNWQVRNQALMHVRNGDALYEDAADAMCFWPEIETAVGAQISPQGRVRLLAPFGTDSLMAGHLTPNPRRPHELFVLRVESKNWLAQWPKLKIVPYQTMQLDGRVAGGDHSNRCLPDGDA